MSEPQVPGAVEDDGVIESMGQFLDDVVDPDFAPAEPEGPWERRQRRLDSWTAIILAVAAVATAWAAFQASQWSGSQSDAQSASALARADSGRSASEATSSEIVDSQMWLSWLTAVANKQTDRATFYRQRFSPTLAAAQTQWLASAPPPAPGYTVGIPPGTPMDLPVYVVPAQARADALAAQSENDLADADRYSSYANKFVLLAVLLALVLFFASIAVKFTSPKLQVVLILVSLLLLGFSLVRMLLLPQLIW